MASSSKAPADDIEKLLNREASAFQREVEVERILKAFKFNAYEILDLDERATADEIKRKYRQLSLFIHPDKTPHARAPEAFDLLKKAESELSDTAKREELDAVVRQARILILKAQIPPLPVTIHEGDDAVKGMKPPFQEQVRAKAKELLIEEEVRRRTAVKMNLANEGFEARKKDEEVASRKRKAEDEKAWEEGREERVGGWRDFSKNKTKKKKKQKVAILG
ncbi:DnaJ-domain-containing protein, partial [Cylindrobasidium torrendii FP15055 ss-10]